MVSFVSIVFTSSLSTLHRCKGGGKFYMLMVSLVDVPPSFFSTLPVLTQVHTALFASVEAGGSVQLWDLNTNTEVPTAICKPDKVNCLNKVNCL